MTTRQGFEISGINWEDMEKVNEMLQPLLDYTKCVSCGICVRKCQKLSTGTIKAENYSPVRDHDRCIGCRECVLNCPTGAWSRNENI